VSERDPGAVELPEEAPASTREGRLVRRSTQRGERLGGFIYGTILTISVVVTAGRAYPHGSGHVALLVFVTTGVFWLAHVYAHALARSVAHSERLSFAELRTIARDEAALIEASFPAIGALVLGSIGLISHQAAIWTALALGLIVLGIQGIAFARIARMGMRGTILVCGINLGLGLFIVALKIAVTH